MSKIAMLLEKELGGGRQHEPEDKVLMGKDFSPQSQHVHAFGPKS